MYHKAIWSNCYHSHYKAQPNTHTKPYKVPNTKPQVGLWIIGGLKNIVREAAEWTAQGICGMWWFIIRDKVVHETTTVCCLAGQNNAFSDIVLGHAKPPTPWSPAFYLWLCLLHQSWQRNMRLPYMYFHIKLRWLSSICWWWQASCTTLELGFSNKRKETIYNKIFQNSRCQGILVSWIEPWAKAVTVTWTNFITAVMYRH
jgi:hypothetical protein